MKSPPKITLRITDSTDGKNIGYEFVFLTNQIVFGDGVTIDFDKTIPLTDGIRFASSSYIIDTIQVK
jgi:hypothetical protein